MRSPTGAACTGQLSAGAVGNIPAPEGPQPGMQVTVEAWCIHAGGIQCQQKFQRQAAAQRSCRECRPIIGKCPGPATPVLAQST